MDVTPTINQPIATTNPATAAAVVEDNLCTIDVALSGIQFDGNMEFHYAIFNLTLTNKATGAVHYLTETIYANKIDQHPREKELIKDQVAAVQEMHNWLTTIIDSGLATLKHDKSDYCYTTDVCFYLTGKYLEKMLFDPYKIGKFCSMVHAWANLGVAEDEKVIENLNSLSEATLKVESYFKPKEEDKEDWKISALYHYLYNLDFQEG